MHLPTLSSGHQWARNEDQVGDDGSKFMAYEFHTCHSTYPPAPSLLTDDVGLNTVAKFILL